MTTRSGSSLASSRAPACSGIHAQARRSSSLPTTSRSPQRAFLDAHGEGVFHLGFTVPDPDAAEANAQALGLRPWMRGRLEDRSGFTYFNTREQGAGVTLEIRANKRV